MKSPVREISYNKNLYVIFSLIINLHFGLFDLPFYPYFFYLFRYVADKETRNILRIIAEELSIETTLRKEQKKGKLRDSTKTGLTLKLLNPSS